MNAHLFPLTLDDHGRHQASFHLQPRTLMHFQALHTCRTFTLTDFLCHLGGGEGWTAQQVGAESVSGICRDQQQPWNGQQVPTGRRYRGRSERLQRLVHITVVCRAAFMLGLTKLLVVYFYTDCWHRNWWTTTKQTLPLEISLFPVCVHFASLSL